MDPSQVNNAGCGMRWVSERFFETPNLGAGPRRNRCDRDRPAAGGATDTGMIPNGLAPDVRSRHLDPSIIAPPLLWPVSRAADEATGERLVASLWDPSHPREQAAASARSGAGWAASTP
jgi:hypothetical protein